MGDDFAKQRACRLGGVIGFGFVRMAAEPGNRYAEGMNFNCLARLALYCTVLGLAGCSSSAQGVARIGDTAETVERQMGSPDKKEDLIGGGRRQVVWTYDNYFRQPAQREATGWSEVLTPGTVDQHGRTVEKPGVREIYRTQAKQDIQVTFTEGVVSFVEHLKLAP
jgi:hypothetical protein